MVSAAAAGDYLDELERLQASGLSDTELASALEERAQKSEPGTDERCAFLDAAGDFWVSADDDVHAEAAYRASIEDGGDRSHYAESALVLLLLRADREVEADAILESLLRAARSGELPHDSFEIVAESLEEAGRLRQAMRWFTMPLRDVDPDDLDDGDLVLLHGRYRVRRALGMPEDRFDAVRNELMAEPD